MVNCTTRAGGTSANNDGILAHRNRRRHNTKICFFMQLVGALMLLLCKRFECLKFFAASTRKAPLIHTRLVRYIPSQGTPLTRLFCSGTPIDSRRDLLYKELIKLNIDADSLQIATEEYMNDPLVGYDGRFGKSAQRTYMAFLYPKNIESTEVVEESRLSASAGRCARHIEFLLRRHRAHQAEFVRHTDSGKVDRQTFPLVLVLDNLRSAFNVGSLFRTADAAGCELVLTTGICPSPAGSGSQKLAKSALGAERLVPSQHFKTLADALAFCRVELPEYEILGMETTARSVDYRDHRFCKSGSIIILGNEVTGLDPSAMEDFDAIIEIPMFGAKNSLNVAACAPVVLYEALRQWR